MTVPHSFPISAVAIASALNASDVDKERLRQRAKARGLAIEKILGDGNCFFRAVAAASGSQMDHEEIRHFAVHRAEELLLEDKILHNMKLTQPDQTKVSDPDQIGAWANDMRKDRFHADEHVIWGAACVVSATINVLSGSAIAEEVLPHRPFGVDNPPDIWIGHLPDQIDPESREVALHGHFVALVPESEPFDTQPSAIASSSSSIIHPTPLPAPATPPETLAPHRRTPDISPDRLHVKPFWVPDFLIMEAALALGYTKLPYFVLEGENSSEAVLKLDVRSLNRPTGSSHVSWDDEGRSLQDAEC